jgi:hypothetical protein
MAYAQRLWSMNENEILRFCVRGITCMHISITVSDVMDSWLMQLCAFAHQDRDDNGEFRGIASHLHPRDKNLYGDPYEHLCRTFFYKYPLKFYESTRCPIHFSIPPLWAHTIFVPNLPPRGDSREGHRGQCPP